MAALRVSAPGKGIKLVDLGHGAGVSHDYHREATQAIRFIEWGRLPWRATLAKLPLRITR